MSVDLNDPKSLSAELEKVVINFSDLHTRMRMSMQFYRKSAFYERQAGQANDVFERHQNLLRVFADKNIEYTSELPVTKVLTTGADENSRQSASLREKIIAATDIACGARRLQKKFARDATLRGIAINETIVDLKNRCVKLRRHDPRRCFWQISNDGEDRVIAFWIVNSITKTEIQKTYGFTPKNDILSVEISRKIDKAIDGQDWFTEAIRLDGTTRVHWIGDRLVEEPHKHMLGEIPIDICAPIAEFDGDEDSQLPLPSLYLEPLVPLQAELNDVYYRRGKIVRRMSAPIVWVRGMHGAARTDDVQAQMSQPGGGVLGLKKDGEAGVLQLPVNDVLSDHEDRITLQMTRLSGYGNAAFGESVGANTSGDALAMYFNATQRKVAHQNISWQTFWESIHAKVLRGYDNMVKTGEEINLEGFAPATTIMAVQDKDSPTMQYSRQTAGFTVTITKGVIDGKYANQAIMPTAAPKQEAVDKRFWLDAANLGVVSRTTMYEHIGLDSPEDELQLLRQEKASPELNPQGMQQLASAASAMQQPSGAPGGSEMPSGEPVAPPAGGGLVLNQ